MRVLLVGAGAWGKNILSNLAQMGSLAGVADPRAEVRSKIEEDYPGVRTAPSMDQLFDACDAVAIATPADTHAPLAIEAMQAGKDVFIEKPMTLRLAEAEAIVREAERGGRIAMVGHLLLYQPAVQFIRDQIRAGAIGRLLSLHQERLNLGRARPVENVLWSLGVHDIAVMLFLADAEPEGVLLTEDRFLSPGVADDTYLHLSFRGGIRAHIHNSWLWPERSRKLTVIGEKGMLVFDEIAGKLWLHRKSIGEGLKNVDEGTEELTGIASGSPLLLELGHFLECVQTRAEPISSARKALPVIRILEEASAQAHV